MLINKHIARWLLIDPNYRLSLINDFCKYRKNYNGCDNKCVCPCVWVCARVCVCVQSRSSILTENHTPVNVRKFVFLGASHQFWFVSQTKWKTFGLKHYMYVYVCICVCFCTCIFCCNLLLSMSCSTQTHTQTDNGLLADLWLKHYDFRVFSFAFKHFSFVLDFKIYMCMCMCMWCVHMCICIDVSMFLV